MYRLKFPGLSAGQEIGLGILIWRITSRLGIPHCGSCSRRAKQLNRLVVFYGMRASTPLTGRTVLRLGLRWLFVLLRFHPLAANGPDPCWHFNGSCTGFGTEQCITAPESQEPDAVTITQCCHGWFQYPWIEVCPGESARTGCGFCLW